MMDLGSQVNFFVILILVRVSLGIERAFLQFFLNEQHIAAQANRAQASCAQVLLVIASLDWC